jgi:hypothetical protein
VPRSLSMALVNPTQSIGSRLSIAFLVTVLGYVSLYLSQMGSFADDPGVGWHLKTGELISHSGEIPRYDPFLAGERRAWISDQWLSDLLIFTLHARGGWELLYQVFAGVWIVTFFGVLLPALRAQSGGALTSLIAVVIAFKCAQVHFILRPVVLSLLCFTAAFVVVRDIYRRDLMARREILTRGACLVSLCALWSNLHPAFVLGVLVAGLAFLVYLCEHRCLDFRAKTLGATALLCGVGTLANPYGAALHRSIFALGSSDYFLNLNEEWLPPDFTSFEGIAFLCLAGIPIVTAISKPGFRKRVTWFDLVTTVIFACAALRSVRYIPFASVVATPLFAALLMYSAPRCRIPALKLSARLVGAIEQHERRVPSVALAAWLCFLCGLIGVTRGLLPAQLGPQASRYPPGVVAAIRADASKGVVLASPDWGGTITAALYPSFRAVIDDRNTLIGEDLYRRYFRAMESKRSLDDLVQQFGVTHVIIPANTTVGKEVASSSDWHVIFDDATQVVARVVNGES